MEVGDLRYKKNVASAAEAAAVPISFSPLSPIAPVASHVFATSNAAPVDDATITFVIGLTQIDLKKFFTAVPFRFSRELRWHDRHRPKSDFALLAEILNNPG